MRKQTTRRSWHAIEPLESRLFLSGTTGTEAALAGTASSREAMVVEAPTRRVRPTANLGLHGHAPLQTTIPTAYPTVTDVVKTTNPPSNWVTTTSTTAESVMPLVVPVTTPAFALDYSTLRGDGATDDTAALQAIIDSAVAHQVSTISLPAGVFRLAGLVRFYGNNLTLTGQGNATILKVDHHFTGEGEAGFGLLIQPTFSSTLYYPSAAVTGDTITFSSSVPFAVGESLLLTNGRGSASIIEKRLGGALTDPGNFNELAPIEYATVSAVTRQTDGSTVVKLARPVTAAGDYDNVLPAGAAPSDRYLQVRRITTAASNLTVDNLTFTFADRAGDLSIFAAYVNNLTLRRLTVLTEPTIRGGYGGITLAGCQNVLIETITTSGRAGVGLNSTRFATVQNTNIHQVLMEEGTTDTLITHNIIHADGNIGIRSGDMLCARNTISYNTIHRAAFNYGGIGIWEGRDTVVEDNTLIDGEATIWVGTSRGVIVRNNVGKAFADYGRSATFTSNRIG